MLRSSPNSSLPRLTPLALCTLLAIAATGVACVDAPHEVGSGGEGPGGNGALVAGSSPGGAGSGNAGAAAGTSGGTTGVAGSAAAGAAPTAGSDSVAGAGSIAGASGSGTGSAGSGAGGSGGSGDTHWVGTWTASPYATASDGMPTGGLSLANSVLRQITHASLGGNQIRVQFSNKQGKEALVINAAHVALCKATPKVNGSIDTTTDKALAFSGKANVSVPAGQEIWSDPLDFALPALGNLTITTAFGTVPGALTSHNGSRTTSYIQTGTDVSAASMSAGGTTHWYFISAVDVMAPAAAKGIVAIGDSITDGRGVTVDGNDRWTDVLAARLQANPATANVSIMNQGIGATNLTGTDVTTAENRFARDVLGQSGVKYAIIYDGVNDINGGVDASVMKAVYAKLIKAGRDKGLLVYGGTITPCACARDSVRVEINTYIKSGAFDGVLDFDAALKDPTDPTHMLAAAGSTDNLHPGPAGYKMMADSVDLTLFTK